MKNEKTSARVAKIAGKVLRRVKAGPCGPYVWAHAMAPAICTVAELKALAASCLTQTGDRGKKR